MIGNIAIWTGIIVMIFGSAAGIFEKRFLVKLHKISAADFVGLSLILMGMALNGFEIVKSLLTLIFLAVWSPSMTHTLAKTYVNRMRK